MYDTVGLFLINKHSYNCLSLLSNQTETAINTTGELISRGSLKNLRVKIKDENLSVQGSLSKFYFNDSLKQLTRKDTQLAVEKLSDELHLPIDESKVFRFDIGATFIMSEPVASYYSCLGNLQRFKRSEFSNKQSLLYKTTNKSLLFYDKEKELKRRKFNLPGTFFNRYMLRYEIQFTKKIPHGFKVQEIKASDLFSESLYIKAIDSWKNFYYGIQKIKRLKFNPEGLNMLEVKTLEKQLTLIGLKTIGEGEVLQMLEDCRGKISRMKLSRLKRKIKDLVEQPELTEKNESINELDSKIYRAAKYYR